MGKSISITPGTCTNYAGGSALSDDTVYLRSDNYAVRLRLEIPERLGSLSATVGFRANAGTNPGGSSFYAGLTQTAGSSPPGGETTFSFVYDSNRMGSFTITKKLQPGTWYLWLWARSGGTADILSGKKSAGYPTWSVSGVTAPAGHIYRDGAWKDAAPKVYKDGAWQDAAAGEYRGEWRKLG
ncbi:MAG: hypothetical protein IJE26_02180 [Oscillospiraceae bacterium]|nr:hypothetical protein [Oscillospiraceae bacterium]